LIKGRTAMESIAVLSRKDSWRNIAIALTRGDLSVIAI
jgi:hypothetical protein